MPVGDHVERKELDDGDDEATGRRDDEIFAVRLRYMRRRGCLPFSLTRPQDRKDRDSRQ